MAGGRPRAEDPVIFVKIGLHRSVWDHVFLWRPDDPSPTRNLQELVERSIRMFPKGPGAFGREVKQSRRRAPQAVKGYAEKHGLTRSEALAEIAQRWFKEHPEEVA